jgi:hypothetical protein
MLSIKKSLVWLLKILEKIFNKQDKQLFIKENQKQLIQLLQNVSN